VYWYRVVVAVSGFGRDSNGGRAMLWEVEVVGGRIRRLVVGRLGLFGYGGEGGGSTEGG
jgi:hypothetical protein